MSLNDIATYLFLRYHRLGRIDDLNGAIFLSRDALSLRPPKHPGRSASLQNLALYLSYRYMKLEGTNDLNEAIAFSREALPLYQSRHPDRAVPLNLLSLCLSYRYSKLGEIKDLNEAIVLGREALLLLPPRHPQRSNCLNNLASYLSIRYDQFGRIDDLNEAIVLSRDSLTLRPLGHPGRVDSLSGLGSYLSSRYKQLGQISDLNEAIALSRDALLLCPPGHPDRSRSLNDLANYLSSRYIQFGGIDSLDEAIVLCKESLSLCPPGHSNRSVPLNNLTSHLSYRYMQLGSVDDLNEAIALGRDALSLSPIGHPTRPTCLNNLANCLSYRYTLLGGIDDLNDAISLGRDALSLRPPGHSDRLVNLNNVASYLACRYKQLGGIDDVNEAIALSRNALLLCPSGNPDRSMTLNNLANHLICRYGWIGRIDDLNEAIVLCQDALSLCPPGYSDRIGYLNNLTHCLTSRYNQLGRVDDLKEAMVFARDALSSCPPGHGRRTTVLNNLVYCFSQHTRLGRIDDLDKVIVFARETLSLCQIGHPDWSTSLHGLARLHLIRFAILDQKEDEEDIFNLYPQLEHLSQVVSSFDLEAAKAWTHAAEAFRHPTTLLAYETALRLLAEHLVALPSLPRHLTVLKTLSSSLAVDAFSACLRNKSPMKAIELLEQGRAVFWSQLTRLRSPLDDVIASGRVGKALADEFTRLTSLIRVAIHSPDTNQHDRVCRLNQELQSVVSKIRRLPNLSRFLLPALFSDLQSAASGGPVIVVNASRYSCDALVVFVDKDPVHIPLPVEKEDVQGLSSRLRELTRLATRMNVTKDLQIFLRELWDRVVSHIIDFLQTTCPLQSRIWWCPTAEFSLLPLHAASPFRTGQRGVSDLYTSSYTTTLTSLIRARRPDSMNENKRFIAIGQAAAEGAGELLSVNTELTNIGQLVNGLVTFTRIEGEESCVSNVADKLGKNEWVHFACHGTPNQKLPFESAFALRDGPFTIQHIIQCNLENPEFAYLSACHTTVGDQESPDEMIHLASAMQFAGFRSVIGTMWAVDDAETNRITSVFYKHLADDGRLDYTRAARALRKTMRSLTNISIDQRILYIHLGA